MNKESTIPWCGSMIAYAQHILKIGKEQGKTTEQIQADIDLAFNPPYDFYEDEL